MNPGISNKQEWQWRGERGAALVVALMVMVICALLGAASILTSNTDIQISMNERVYHEALMNADAGVQWLRTQDLEEMSGFANMDATNAALAAVGEATGIRFQIPQPPQFVWNDPRAGNAAVYRVRSQGQDRNGRGQVVVEAEIRVAFQEGEVRSEGPPGYAGSN
ncbi:MAG: pilus assembly PilX N-terminal domain-containing protein [bacterium]